ncbi:MAG: FkbM family methyltransferase [Bradyrhizobium sp.]
MGFLDFLQTRPRGFRAEARPEGVAPYPFWIDAAGSDDAISRDILRSGMWQAFETTLVQRMLPHFDAFVEAGANIGWYTALAQRVMKPTAQIHAFEPDPQNFGLLKLNTSGGVSAGKGPTTRLTRAAISDHAGSARLFHSPTSVADHSLFASPGASRSISVPVTALDTHFAKTDLPPMLAKLDAKGNEPRIFSGASKVLSPRLRENAYILEFWPNGVMGAGENVEAFAALLATFEQRPFVIYHESGGLRPTTWDELGGRTKTGVSSMRQYFLDILMVTPGTPAYFAVSDFIVTE